MKKLILVFAAIGITAGAFAQTDSLNNNMHQRDMNYNQHQNMQNNPMDKSHPDGVMMQDGKIMKVENGQLTTLDRDMTMSNGTKILSDGNYTNKDGTTLKLKEGEHMDMEGNVNFLKSDKYKNKDNDKDHDMYLVPDSTRTKNW